jgi:hypothetical protein
VTTFEERPKEKAGQEEVNIPVARDQQLPAVSKERGFSQVVSQQGNG